MEIYLKLFSGKKINGDLWIRDDGISIEPMIFLFNRSMIIGGQSNGYYDFLYCLTKTSWYSEVSWFLYFLIGHHF